MKSEKLDWGLRSSKFPPAVRTWAQFLMLLRHQHKLSRVSQGQDIVAMTPTPTTGVFTWRKHGRFLPTCFYESKNIIEIWSVSAYPNVDFLLAIATIWDHNHWPCILVACIQYVWRVKSGKLSFICITITPCQYQYFLLSRYISHYFTGITAQVLTRFTPEQRDCYQEHEIDLKYLPKSHGWVHSIELYFSKALLNKFC